MLKFVKGKLDSWTFNIVGILAILAKIVDAIIEVVK